MTTSMLRLREHRELALIWITGITTIVAQAWIMHSFNIYSTDEYQYLEAMKTIGFERHPGFWLLAAPFYHIAGISGVILFQIIMYTVST